MTTHNPLVRVSGKIVELPAGDSVGGALAGASGTNGINGGAVTIGYTFDTTTTDADPGGGKLRLNNATQNTATAIYADLLDTLGSDWTTVIDTFDDSTNTVKGSIRLVKSGDASKFLTFNVTAITTATGYRKITISNTGSSSSSPFANADTILLCFDRAGDKGADGGAGGGDFVRITETVTSSSQASVTFSSIASTYRDLQVRVRARCTATAVTVDLLVRLNSDTGAHYDYEQMSFYSNGSGAAQAVAQTSWKMAEIPAASAPANAAGAAIIDIYDYRGTTFYKAANSRWNGQNGTGTFSQGVGVNGGTWRDTSAVTAVDVFFSSGNFVNGSIVTLYGVN